MRDDEPAFYRYDQTFVPPGRAAHGAIRRRGFLALVRLVPVLGARRPPARAHALGPEGGPAQALPRDADEPEPGLHALPRPARARSTRPLAIGRAARRVRDAPTACTTRSRRCADADARPGHRRGHRRSSTLLIADGHHRYETALRYAEETSEAHPEALAPRRAPLLHDVPRQRRRSRTCVVFPTHRHVHSLAVLLVRRPARGRAAALVRGRRRCRAGPTPRPCSRLCARRGQARAPSVAAAARDGRVVLLTLRGDVDLAAHPTLGKQARRSCARPTSPSCTRAILEALLGITPEAQAAKTNLWYPQDAARRPRRAARRARGTCSS